jgi:hypothetical protein
MIVRGSVRVSMKLLFCVAIVTLVIAHPVEPDLYLT